MSISLTELLAKAKIATPLTQNPGITGISDYSSRVKPGNIFVAIKGYQLDGHDFIPEAIANGAAAIFAEKNITSPVPVIVVPDTRIALAELSNAWYNFPAEAMTMIGVTASNGKTTTAFMIDHILSEYFPATGLIGTVIIKDGKTAVSADLTTPNSRELYEFLAAMDQNQCSHVTMEVSSAGQQLHRIHGIPYKIATFNNVSREHIDFHGSFEKYWEIKTQLIKNLAPSSIAVLNADEPMILALKEQTQAEAISYSVKNNPADISVENLDLSTGAGSFKYVIRKDITGANFSLAAGELAIKLKVLGMHNVYNAAVAITVAKLCGVPDAQIQSALATFTGVERRFQLIYDGQYKIIDDHFANAGNINMTLETLGLMKYNKLHLVLAIRGNRGSIVNGENAEAVVKWVPHLPLDQLIISDSVEFVNEHDWVSEEERATFLGILDQAGIRYSHYPQLTEALQAVLAAVSPGDVILLGGCQGMDHGAHVIIPLVAQNHTSREQQEILKILRDRVAGSS